jgi:hypothetical protein
MRNSYVIRENRELRTNEWQIDRNNGTATKRRAPARVDCSYLITAWASDTSTTPALDEHLLLGEVMQALLRHPSIPDEVLQGRLQGQDPPLPAAALCRTTRKAWASSGRRWAANPRQHSTTL